MTCREKLAMEHPDCLGNAWIGGCKGCPSDYGYMSMRDGCELNEKSCTRCWDRELSEAVGDVVHNAVTEQWENIAQIIEDAMRKRDRTVSIFFDPETGMSVSVFPWPDADELYEMYKKGQITGNDFRVKMGLNPVKNPESFMKRSMLDREFQIPKE